MTLSTQLFRKMDAKREIRFWNWIFLGIVVWGFFPLGARGGWEAERYFWQPAPVGAEPWPEWLCVASPISSATSVTESLRHLVAEGLDAPMAACVGDLDKDGKLDVVAADLGLGKLIWWRNGEGSGKNWEQKLITENFPGANAVEAVDLDGDGDLDVVGAAYEPGNEISWWENVRGNGAEWVVHTVALGVDRARAVRGVDMNRDGRPELLVAALGGGLTWWERPAQTGGLWKKHEVASPNGGVAGVWGGDLDGDGDLDMVAALPERGVMWWENLRGDGLEWKEHPAGTPLDGAEEVRLGDLDADGDLDIVTAASRSDRVCWLENGDGKGGSWTLHEIQREFDGAYGVALADLDGDGDLDVAGVSRFGNAVVWWENGNGRADSWKAYRLEADFTNACAVLTGVLERGGRPGVLAVACGKGTIAWWEASKAVEMPMMSLAETLPVDGTRTLSVSPPEPILSPVPSESVGEAERQEIPSPVLAQSAESRDEFPLFDLESWDSLVEDAQRRVLLEVVQKVGSEVSEPAPVERASSSVARQMATEEQDWGIWMETFQSPWERAVADVTVNAARMEKIESSNKIVVSEARNALWGDLVENPFSQIHRMRAQQSWWEEGQRDFALPEKTEANLMAQLSAIPVQEKNLETLLLADNKQEVEKSDAALNAVSLTLRDFAGEPGALTRLRVGCRQPKGISGFDVKVSYDPKLLSVQRVVGTSFTQSCMLADNGTMAKGELSVTAVSRQTLDSGQGEEALFEVEFKVAEDAQPGAVVRSIFLGANLFDSLMSPVSVVVTDEAFFRVLPRFVVGDANGDGRVNAADAMLALRFSRGIETLEAQSFLAPSTLERVDMNKDGRVDGVDVRLIQSLAVGISLNSDTIAAAEKAESATQAQLARSVPESSRVNMPQEPVFPNEPQEASVVVQAGQAPARPEVKKEETGMEKSEDPADAVSDSRLEILQMLLEKTQRETAVRSEEGAEGGETESAQREGAEPARHERKKVVGSSRPVPDSGDSKDEESETEESEKKSQSRSTESGTSEHLNRMPVPEKVIEMRAPERIHEVPEQKELPQSKMKL